MKIKIFHGPVNIAGIGGYLAKAQREQGFISDFITYRDDTMRQNHDIDLHLDNYNRVSRTIIKLIFFIFCLLKYNIFHFYFGMTLFPFGLDLPILKLFRKKILMAYCGSDIRLISDVEKKRNPYFHLLNIGLDSPKFDNRKKRMMRWQNLWIDKFSAVRNQYANARIIIPKHKIIKDLWINNTMDMDAFYPSFKTKSIPVLIHAPSNPQIKGSEYVEKAVAALKAEGYKFEYIRLEKIPNDEAQRILRDDADIIIDQLLLGGFGNLTVEAMYYGKPVCCYLAKDVLLDCPDCPIVNCTIENLKEKLARLIKHPEERVQLGKKGRIFVEKHCDRRKINQRILEIYNELVPKTQ